MLAGASTQITYLIPMELGMEETSVSPFCGFSQEFVDKSYFLSMISQLPQDVCELSSSSYLNIASRKEFGDYKIFVLNISAISSLPYSAITPFICIFSSISTHDDSVKIIQRLPIKVLHVSEVERDGAILPSSLTRKRFKKEMGLIAHEYLQSLHASDAKYLKKLMSGRPKTFRASSFNLRYRIHNIVRPSECALQAHRYKLGYPLHLGEGGIESYAKGIVDVSEEIFRIRKLVSKRFPVRKNDFIIGLPSFYAYLYKDKGIRDVMMRFGGKSIKGFFEKHILRYRGYIATDVNVSNMSELIENQYISAVTKVRQQELFAFTNLMSILASEDFAPFIRLPNDLNLMQGMLDNIESLACNSAKKKSEKLNRAFSNVSSYILDAIPHEIKDLIKISGEKGLVVSDYPVEWMCLDNDMPLLFTREICRIGSTPGNVLSDLICNNERVEFNVSHVKKILVLRSFSDDDPIRNLLEFAVNEFSKKFNNGTEVLFVDLDSEQELYEALNAYKPFLAVFDCHGNHGGRNEHSWLQIGGDKVNVWKLRGKCHVPVIAVLSACSTHPVAGSHASVANGLLSSGVLGVLATSVPIPAVDAAAFIARLIYRLDTYLPLQLKLFSHKVCWREFVTKMLRMSYSTDILQDYRDSKPQWISDEQYMQIHYDMNIEINMGNVNWHFILFERLSAESGRPLREVKEFYIRNIRFKHTAFYAQIGRPDKVYLVRDGNHGINVIK